MSRNNTSKKSSHNQTIALEDIKTAIEKLIKDNNDNFDNIDSYEDKSYAKGYAEGVHDGLLDVLNQFGIETDEEYFN